MQSVPKETIDKRFVGTWRGAISSGISCADITHWETYRAPDGLFTSRIFSSIDDKNPSILYGMWWIKNDAYYDTISQIKFANEVWFSSEEIKTEPQAENIEKFKFEGKNVIRFWHFVISSNDECRKKAGPYETTDSRITLK